MKGKFRSKDIAFLSLIFALILILSLLPSFTTVSLAFALIPICVAAELKNWKLGAIAGCFYGLISCVSAWTFSASPLRFVFQNPLVSVLPRILVGIVAYFTYVGIRKLTHKKDVETGALLPKFKVADSLSVYLGSLSAVLVNTFLVIALMLLFYNGHGFSSGNAETTLNIKYVLTAILGINTLLEIIIIPILVTPIVYALKKAKLDK